MNEIKEKLIHQSRDQSQSSHMYSYATKKE